MLKESESHEIVRWDGNQRRRKEGCYNSKTIRKILKIGKMQQNLDKFSLE